MRRLILSVVPVATLVGLVGCKPTVQTDLPICKAEVVGEQAQEVASGELPANIWFLTLLRNYNLETSEVKRPVLDCRGQPVEPTEKEAAPSSECAEEATSAAALPPRPLTEADLVTAPLPDGRKIVWVKTTHYEDGMAVGPVAVAELNERGVAIRAIGTLRAQAERATMRVEPMGNTRVLVIESRVCDPENPNLCRRLTRLLPMLGDQFVELPLITETGACLGPAEFEMHREREVELEDGLLRSFEMATSIDFSEGQAVVTEQVNIEDSDPKQPDAPAKVFRKANLQRPLQLTQQGIVTKPGLWESMLQEHGSVRVEAPPADAEEDEE